MTSISTTSVVTIALLAALVFLLGANVTRLRATSPPGDAQFRTDPSAPLLKAIRAHGNATEYIPTLAVLILILGTSTDDHYATLLMVAAVGFRIIHAAALLTCATLAANTVPRSIGAAGTYLTGIGLIAAVLLSR
jgi:uncharacterized membrane protein YecN with MAPEG domain